ncbi:MAG: hypothetical protein N3B10_15645, partial [Armatimonadetes bacterium]|nr:hypothetical protein [Armatimonadota bacterium]
MDKFGETNFVLYFRTEDNFEKVKNWYRQLLLLLGWEYDEDEGFFHRGGESLDIRIHPFGFEIAYSSDALP